MKKQHKETSDKLAELEEQNIGAVEELELAKEELKKSEKALKGTQDKVRTGDNYKLLPYILTALCVMAV